MLTPLYSRDYMRSSSYLPLYTCIEIEREREAGGQLKLNVILDELQGRLKRLLGKCGGGQRLQRGYGVNAGTGRGRRLLYWIVLMMMLLLLLLLLVRNHIQRVHQLVHLLVHSGQLLLHAIQTRPHCHRLCVPNAVHAAQIAARLAQRLVEATLQLLDAHHHVQVALRVLLNDVAHVVWFAGLLELATRHKVLNLPNGPDRIPVCVG